mgnify:FL=1
MSLGSRTPRYQGQTVSLRAAPVRAPLASPTGIIGAEQAKQRVLGLASSTLVEFQRQNIIAQQATDDIYYAGASSDLTANVSRIYEQNRNPNTANKAAMAYIETTQTNAPERYKEQLGVMGRALNNTLLAKSRSSFSKNLQLDQQNANQGSHDQIIENAKNVDVSTPEGQTLSEIYLARHADSRERMLQSEALRKGYQTSEQLQLLEQKYAVKHEAEIQSIQVSQLTSYAIGQNNMIGFMAAVQTGTTGVAALDNLPNDVKLKAAERVKQAYNTQLQADNYEEKQQEKQREEKQLALGEQLVGLNPADPAYRAVEEDFVSTGTTYQDRKNLREFSRNLQNKTTKTDPLLLQDLTIQIYDGEGPNIKTEILKGEYLDGLSAGDVINLMNLVKQQENEFFKSPTMNAVKERMYTITGGKTQDIYALFRAANGQTSDKSVNADSLVADQLKLIGDVYDRGEIKTAMDLSQYAEQHVYPALREAMGESEPKTYKTVEELNEDFDSGDITSKEYESSLEELNSADK